MYCTTGTVSMEVLPEVLPYLEVQRTRTYGNRTEIDILFPEVRRYSSCTTTCTVSYFVRVLPEVLSYFRTVGLHVLSCTVHTRSVQYQLSMIVVLSVHVQ